MFIRSALVLALVLSGCSLDIGRLTDGGEADSAVDGALPDTGVDSSLDASDDALDSAVDAPPGDGGLPLPAPPTAITTGGDHTCVVTRDEDVYCWGRNSHRQVTDSGDSPIREPTFVIADAEAVEAGANHTCAIAGDAREVLCWGDNERGQAGVDPGMGMVVGSPTRVSGLASQPIETLALGFWHSCATDTAGVVYCWGQDVSGELGDGSCGGSRHLAEAASFKAGMPVVAAGDGPTCAFDEVEGILNCWGYGRFGAMGQADPMGPEMNCTPEPIFAPPDSVTRVSIGGYAGFGGAGHGGHVCVVSSGTVYCWGRNERAQVGPPPSPMGVPAPAALGASKGIDEVTTGGAHTCSLDTDGGEVICWGDNTHGQLGNGTIGADTVTHADASNAAAGIAQVSAGRAHTCALTAGPAAEVDILCWGANDHGQVGGLDDDVSSPRPFRGAR